MKGFVVLSAAALIAISAVSTRPARIMQTRVAVAGIVVNKDNGSPVPNAKVAVMRRESEFKDTTNEDGVYCFYIPRELGKFALVYNAPNYFDGFSTNQNSNQELIKFDRLFIEAQKPNDDEQLARLSSILEIEIEIYTASTSAEMKEQIKSTLNRYHDAIVVPPAPPLGLNDPPARILRLDAKARIENALFKLK